MTSKPKHVGHAGERELLLAMFEATGGKSFVDPIELKKLGKEPKSNWRKTGGWDPAVGDFSLHLDLGLLGSPPPF